MQTEPQAKTKIAIIIKTTPNRFSLKWLLLSIEHALSQHTYRLYIADEQPLPEWKQWLYDELKARGHHVKVWDQPVAVTIARNDLINSLRNETFVLRVDDDFELGGEFNIDAMLTILKQDNIDFCCDVERQIGEGKGKISGETRIESGHILFRKKNRPVIKFITDSSWKYSSFNGISFAKADYMRNLILLKRKVFERVCWNENLLFTGEHVDFFLELKHAGFQGAFTNASIHLHRDDLKQSAVDIKEEKGLRIKQRKEVRDIELENKWGGKPEKRRSVYNRFYRRLKSFRSKQENTGPSHE